MPLISSQPPQFSVFGSFTETDIVKLKATGQAVKVLQSSTGKADAPFKGRSAIGGEIGARGVQSYANYTRDVLLGYQKANPKALVVLNDTDPNKAGDCFVHPAFAFYALSNTELKRGDKAHFLRSLQNLAAAPHMPYDARWLAAFCVVSCPDSIVIKSDRDQVLDALGNGPRTGKKISSTLDLAQNAPQAGVLGIAHSLAENAKGSLQAIARKIVVKSEEIIAAHPPLAVKLEVALDVPDTSLNEEEEALYLDENQVDLVEVYVFPSAAEAAQLGASLAINKQSDNNQEVIARESAEGEGRVEADLEVGLHQVLEDNLGPAIKHIAGQELVFIEDYESNPKDLQQEYNDWVFLDNQQSAVMQKAINITAKVAPMVVQGAYDQTAQVASTSIRGASNLLSGASGYLSSWLGQGTEEAAAPKSLDESAVNKDR